jgi:hypothetical protein
MRLSSISWLLCTAASAVTARVVVFDTSSPSRPASEEIVNPGTASLILAQRIGLGEYHSIASADEEAIRHINAFSSSQQHSLFGHDRHAAPVHKLLVMVAGVDYDTEAEIRSMTIVV